MGIFLLFSGLKMSVQVQDEQFFPMVKRIEEDSDNEVPMELQKIINESRRNFLTSMEFEEDDHRERKESLSKKKSWKPVLGMRIRQSITYDDNDELPEYELKRLQNIQEKQKLFLDQMKKSSIALKPQTTFSGNRKGKMAKQKGKVYLTRSRKSDFSENCIPELSVKKLRFETECTNDENCDDDSSNSANTNDTEFLPVLTSNQTT